MVADPVRVCIVGAGPRGLSILERLCANAGSATVEIHMVDRHLPGPGEVWRVDQSRHLLMNTVAAQVSMFTDETVEMAGPVVAGPSLWEWASGQVADAEARRLGPDSYPSRAFYGRYLSWVYRQVVARAPSGVSVRFHRGRAVRLEDDGSGRRQRVLLDDGRVIDGLDAVVLAQGHVPTAPTRPERILGRFADRHGLSYLPPVNPAEADLGRILPGEPVLLRGLGLCFFDYLALLTVGRGGVFERRDGRLRYRPSGLEPMIYAGSRRGVPHQARGRNQKGAYGRHLPRVLTAEVALEVRGAGGVDFRRDVWPLIAKEVETVYYATLLAGRLGERAVELFREMYLPLAWGSGAEADLLDRFDVPLGARWDWRPVMDPPAGRTFAGRDGFRSWLLEHLRADVAEAGRGNVGSPMKAALDVLRDLRNEIRLVVDHGGLSGRSHRADLDGWYSRLNAYLSIGPPASRVEEAVALVEAGLLEFAGPRVRVAGNPAGRCFEVTSALGGERIRVVAVIEARLDEPDLRRTTDPLLKHLLDSGQAAAYRIGGYETGGLAVTTRPHRLVGAAGGTHPRRFAVGVPTESVHWVTAAGIRPGVGSVSLSDADAIARSLLGLGPDDGPGVSPHHWYDDSSRWPTEQMEQVA